jgi:MGT family glycosyltransferase
VGPRGAAGQDLPAAQDGPLLFVSLGTIFNDQAAFFLACLDAFAGTRWQVVLAVGDRVDLDAIGPVPANASVHRRVAQLDVLSRASVFITHGGMNSTMEGILAGVPLVVVPQQEEQAVTAERVSELGLGTHLMPDDATSEALAEAVARVCADEGIRERVAAMRRAAVEAGGPARAAEEILRRVPSRPSG